MGSGRRLILAAFVPIVICGCGRRPAYAASIKKQIEACQEVTALLRGVTDEASMKQAGGELRQRFERFDRLSRQVKVPDDPDLKMKLQEELGAQMESAYNDLLKEIRRISDLPGGKDFLANLDKIDPKRRLP
jgi:DNA mismatch repair ATPase MutS